MLGDQLKATATERNVDNRTLAQTAGIPESALKAILEGNAIPTIPQTFQLARALREPVSTFIQERNDDIENGQLMATLPGLPLQGPRDQEVAATILSLAASLQDAAFSELQGSSHLRAAEAARLLGSVPEPTDPYSVAWDALMIDAAGALGVAAALANSPEVRLEAILSLTSHNGHASEILACREAAEGTDDSRAFALHVVAAHDPDLGAEMALRALDHPRTSPELRHKAQDLLRSVAPETLNESGSAADPDIRFDTTEQLHAPINESMNSREVAEAIGPLIASKSLSSVHPDEWVKINESAPDICQVILTGFTAHPDPHERAAAYTLMGHTEIMNQRTLLTRGMSDENPQVQQAAKAVHNQYYGT